MTDRTAYLVMEDGAVFQGVGFGAVRSAFGEVVFNTSMTGYQEMLTDPSYAGQIVIPTYPLIGNYGINERDFESKEIRVAGFAVREHCTEPSHNLSSRTLHEFLESRGIPGIAELDTRAVTRRLRTRGVMMGAIAINEAPESALRRLHDIPSYGETDFVSHVTTDRPYKWTQPAWSRQPVINESRADTRIVVFDCGLKYNILRLLRSKGCEVSVVPCSATAENILALNPSGVLLSPGPGDPELLDYAVGTTKRLIGQVPVMGICLGNQIIARAFGGKTFKLKFGHRGGNHPVRDNATGLVHITAQNHGYAVDPDTLPADLEVSHTSMNDYTVEGLRHRSLPVMSIQYHSEASPGPCDNEYLFDRFMEMVKVCSRKTNGGTATV